MCLLGGREPPTTVGDLHRPQGPGQVRVGTPCRSLDGLGRGRLWAVGRAHPGRPRARLCLQAALQLAGDPGLQGGALPPPALAAVQHVQEGGERVLQGGEPPLGFLPELWRHKASLWWVLLPASPTRTEPPTPSWSAAPRPGTGTVQANGPAKAGACSLGQTLGAAPLCPDHPRGTHGTWRWPFRDGDRSAGPSKQQEMEKRKKPQLKNAFCLLFYLLCWEALGDT